MADQPNVLMIVCDQMVARLMGAYSHPVSKTPNLSRLAKEGVRFDSAYTSCPICVPARSSLLTGQYVSRTGCFDNAAMFPADQPTLAHYLSIAGYDTVASGKFHFVGPDQLHGFEKRLTTDIFPSDFGFMAARPKDGHSDFADVHEHPIAIDYVTAGVRQWSMGLDFDEETHFRSLEYLRGKRSHYTGTLQKALPPRDERPFFLCASFTHPHEPFHVTQELWDAYDGAEIELPWVPDDLARMEHPMDKMLNAYHGTHRVDLDDPEALLSLRRAYLGLVTYVDRKVGELLRALGDLGLAENTLLMFLSDHGDMLGERRMVQKRSFYEYSAQIPWIVWYPGVLPGGVTVPEPVSIVDVMPTILDLVGVPDDAVLPIDGRSVVPLMRGQRDPERTVFGEIHGGGVTTTCFMVRRGAFKYMHVTGHPAQLYNVRDDPREERNLSGRVEYAGIESDLYAALLSEFDSEDIEQRVTVSLARRRVVKAAMLETGLPKWDYQPFFDATDRYWRKG